MIYRLEVYYRRLRRLFNRSEWMLSLLGLNKQAPTDSTTGLLIIQIDGLSHAQLNTALENKRLPFLHKLINKEHYQLHDLYSGAPSTTPAVQAELFYGVKTAVPAFSFKSRDSQQVVRMDRYQAAFDVEQRLAKQGEPLLKGGSSYSKISRGGAREANFCSSSIGWSGLMNMANPLSLVVFILLNLYSFVRVAVLMLLEFLLAFIDFFRGIIARQDLFRELQFVSTRVAISILLRELVTIGAKLDVARGLPIVHLNFLGYDEQAHRRGPSSKFAHWSLKGIDDAVSRIWHGAKSSSRREYEVWIYSDHGQEETVPYTSLHGETVGEAIKRVFVGFNHGIGKPTVSQPLGIESQRAKYLGGGWFQKLLPFKNGAETLPHSNEQCANSVSVTSMGPMGSIYTAQSLSSEQRETLAQALVTDGKIPLVLASVAGDQVKAWNRKGVYLLPQDGEKIFGEQHPFLHGVIEDMIRLCHHPEAGELLISGWSVDKPYCTFAMENGSHGGPGMQETHAFALLPGDTYLPPQDKGYLRPVDLYEVALHTLGRKNKGPKTKPSFSIPSKSMAKDKDKDKDKAESGAQKSNSLRILTYNVHSCRCMDGRLSPRRIAKVIAQYQPDVVALQELDAGKSRTQFIDQAHAISQYLKMEFHFHPAMHVEEERYGNAILTHLPLKLIKAGNLPLIVNKPLFEPRGVIWVSVEVNGVDVQIINTHFGFRPMEHLVQVKALLGRDWLGSANCQQPLILCGDFNLFPRSAAYKRIVKQMHDMQLKLQGHRPLNTFSGRFPSARIDHIFANSMIDVLKIQVPRTHLTRSASDHLPLIADLQLTVN
ncbi:MAG: endonuclease/exonuclease/phosphatase family metal-dependent hydrolase [Paraglaciecola sp.]|jgi:endonuclease/exonuclease/phosphatase family metal-dependent hydrolase